MKMLLGCVLSAPDAGHWSASQPDVQIPAIEASQDGPICSITVTLGLQMVIELAQQIAWLTCALRCPPTGLTVAACYPALTVNRVSDTNKHSEVVLVSCRIETIFKQHEPSSTDSDGRCWESLFRSNVLASGFPISARTLPNTGIELSMGVLAQLLHTRQAVQFGSRIILKGSLRWWLQHLQPLA